MKYMELKITTLSPVILTANRSTLMTNSENSISGTILRGIYAQKYIHTHHLEASAHQDEHFRRFFFGDLRFVTARPMKHGQRSIMIPRSIQVSKDGLHYNDMLVNPTPEDYTQGFKGKKGLAVLNTAGKIDYVNVSKNTSLHIARHSDANRIAGSSQDGSVFTYEAIEHGEEFLGYIIGANDTIDAFAKEIQPYDAHCYIGRSSKTQYGHCHLEISAPQDIAPINPRTNKICIRLETPLITTGYVTDANKSLQEMFNHIASGLKVGKIFGAQEELYGYNNAWKTKLPSQYALASGTVFELENTVDWNNIDLTDILYQGLGIRREEGYGQLRLWEKDAQIQPWDEDNTEKSPHINYTVNSQEVQRAAKVIIETKMENLVKMDAYKDVLRLSGQLKGKTHAFALLESLLGTRTKDNLINIQENMGNKLQEIKSQRFHEHLKSIKLEGVSLEEKILEASNYAKHLPQALQDFALKTNNAHVAEGKTVFTPEIRGAAYYDYWLWFFRHARKAAQSKKRGE